MDSILLFVLIFLGAFFIFIILKKIKMRYKLLVLLVISLILFGYFSMSSAFEGQKVNLTNFNGVSNAAGVYFSWLSSVLGNAETITSRVVENDTFEMNEK